MVTWELAGLLIRTSRAHQTASSSIWHHLSYPISLGLGASELPTPNSTRPDKHLWSLCEMSFKTLTCLVLGPWQSTTSLLTYTWPDSGICSNDIYLPTHFHNWLGPISDVSRALVQATPCLVPGWAHIIRAHCWHTWTVCLFRVNSLTVHGGKNHRGGNLKLSDLWGLTVTEVKLEQRPPQSSNFLSAVFPEQESIPLLGMTF